MIAGAIDTAVLASGNAGKLREMQALLANLGISVVAQRALGVVSAEETGSTFVENALIKARHASEVTGLPAIADDSGLVVAALDGAPGIFSARYAGQGATDRQNVDKLLTALRGQADRRAHFHCAVVFVREADDAAPLLAEASWHGLIAHERHGERGFGYDPVFYDPAIGHHAAELSSAEKNRRSHRAQALKQLSLRLREAYGLGARA